MRPAIAIVGMACRYPDASSPNELWENALAGRRAFRRIPAERLNLNDYLSADRQSPDQTYSTQGAFIEGYEFDRARFRVPGATYRAADPAHWLTLDVAAAALADAGFPEGEGLPHETTGVFVGNTLTGEFSRANTLRLRWPYVRRVVRKVLEEDACTAERQRELLAQIETLYKKPFPPVSAETLAGGLSNTIAGRICNHFDLKGGGYTVDGACASSLLAVINACTSLAAGDLEVAVAGGVDVSTDPFELVGFAKTGALAGDAMRVYDARAAGFWPGEGCGLVVLMRYEDALLSGRSVYAVIRGWGVSSDGSGGITRPEVEGQVIALRRAYARAGYGADTVAYFEGHGTGTAVGDTAELQALTRARREAMDHVAASNGTKTSLAEHVGPNGTKISQEKPVGANGTKTSPSQRVAVNETKASAAENSAAKGAEASPTKHVAANRAEASAADYVGTDKIKTSPAQPVGANGTKASAAENFAANGAEGSAENVGPNGTKASAAVVSSVKAIIGHTKAAAGVAGLIKATMALGAQILPPAVGCDEPHEELKGAASTLRTLKRGELFPTRANLRAGVSAMGFGGINTHITLEAPHDDRRQSLTSKERALLTSAQDAEMFLFSAPDVAQLEKQIERVLAYADRLSRSELTDLAVRLSETLRAFPVRAAVVASTPAELSERLEGLRSCVRSGETRLIDPHAGVFLSDSPPGARVGFLFPGQGSPSYKDGGAWRRRFDFVEDLYAYAEENWRGDGVSTEVAQPAIVASSVAALRVLSRLGITATVAVGHSLGELTALHWAGSLDESSLLRIARARGRAMADVDGPAGAMLSVAADRQAVEQILNGERVVIAGLNSRTQTVLSGEAAEISAVARRAEACGLRTVPLRVSHAFHSSLVASAATRLSAHLEREEFQPLQRQVYSTVTGAHIEPDTDLRALLREQVTSPVRFMEAVNAAAHIDATAHAGVGATARAGVGATARVGAVAAAVDTTARVHVNVAARASVGAPGADIDTAPRARVDAAAHATVDLWLEVGPGHTLSGLIREFRKEPVVALDAGGTSIRGLLNAVGACFCLGVRIMHDELFADRFARPFDLDWRPRFFANPCELAPADNASPDTSRETTATDEVSGDVSNDSQTHPTTTPLEVVRQLVADRLELPVATVEDESRLLDDLHLNSITVAQLVAEAARRLDLPPPPTPTYYANATLSEIADALQAAAHTLGATGDTDEAAQPAGVDDWVREFSIELVERALPRRNGPSDAGDWHVLAPPDHPLKDAVQRSFAQASAGRGVVVLLPPDPDETHIPLLLDAARAALNGGVDFRFVLVEHGGGAASFARTLHLEANNLNTCVVVVPPAHAAAADWVLAEALAVRGYAEAHYDSNGKRREPVLRPLVSKPNPCDLPGLNSALNADECEPCLDGTLNAGECDPCRDRNLNTASPSDVRRRTSRGKAVALGESEWELPLTTRDVLVVTGGARGITAECALRLARESGVRLAIFGLSRPTADEEIVSNLRRFRATGIDFRYYSVDITDAAATRNTIREVETEFGPVTAILHGAARNVPCLIENLDADAFSQTLAPKIRGAQNLLAAIDPDRLCLLITFASIIARTGLPGEAHYGLANEWLTRLTEQWQAAHAHCRSLAIEWSVWSGVGMGARLGTVDQLARRGITPIPVEKGWDALRRLLCCQPGNVAAVVMGRLRDMPTLEVKRPELPFLRFLEKPRVYYPQIELVVDAELSTSTDPYLEDHMFRGERLLPAVMGLEAMAQVFMALAETDEPPIFEKVKFERPVVVHEGVANTIRVAALARTPACVEIVLRSSETGFQVDHFRAVCRVDDAQSESVGDAPLERVDDAPLERTGGTPECVEDVSVERIGGALLERVASAALERMGGRTERVGSGPLESQDQTLGASTRVALDPEQDLYGRVLFHRGRFRRLREYRALKAMECLAEIVPDGNTNWFSQYLPGRLVLGDPGARDAAIHAVQACVPQIAVLPVGVEKITGRLHGHIGDLFVHAKEQERWADGFIYDVELTDGAGCVRERWERLHLRVVSGTEFKGPWPKGLLTPYVERRLMELIPGAGVSIAFEREETADRDRLQTRDRILHRRARSARAMERALGAGCVIRRADGQPQACDGRNVSASHSKDLTMAVAARGPIGCDLELVVTRPPDIWSDMLGVERFALAEVITHETHETLDVAATRVWTAVECLKKAGAGMTAPLVFTSASLDGWVLLASGELKIASCVIQTDDAKEDLAIALLTTEGAGTELTGGGDARV